jgi:hypothetical protein
VLGCDEAAYPAGLSNNILRASGRWHETNSHARPPLLLAAGANCPSVSGFFRSMVTGAAEWPFSIVILESERLIKTACVA